MARKETKVVGTRLPLPMLELFKVKAGQHRRNLAEILLLLVEGFITGEFKIKPKEAPKKPSLRLPKEGPEDGK